MNDIADLMKKIDDLAEEKENIHQDSQYLVFRIFLSRLFLLIFLIGTNQIKTPKEWLILQFDPNIDLILTQIYNLLNFTWNDLQLIFLHMRGWLKTQGIPLNIAIDEVNILLHTHENRFRDSRGAKNM